MATVSTYLNFAGQTEEAFNFYAAAFGTEIMGLMRFSDVPPSEDMPPLSDEDAGQVMHVALRILGDHLLMGTDALESMGHSLTMGNHVSISLSPDSREEADQLHAALSEGGTNVMPMREEFWGDYFGTLTDKFGLQWMINHTPEPS